MDSDKNKGPKSSVTTAKAARAQYYLLFAVFVIATCGLIYELIAGTLASYLLGDSVMQFSTIIGVYLFSMGIGSWLSKYLDGDLLKWFIRIEILVGWIGGISAPLLFTVFEFVTSFRVVLYAMVSLTGILVGLEIPLLMRILQNKVEFKDLVSRVFTFDYIGALLASIIFPLVLVPYLGLIRTTLFFGVINISVAALLLYKFKETARYRKYYYGYVLVSISILLIGMVFAEKIQKFSETLAYQDTIIYSESTPYQRIVITKNNRELRLYLNGNLQFSSADEYRYHEALIHPAAQYFTEPVSVLVLGGGDGLAVRELLKYKNVRDITLVDLDPAMTRLFTQNRLLSQLNDQSLKDKKVHVINEDAFVWLKTKAMKSYQLIVVDFPDPSNYSIGKLYSNVFYKELYKVLDTNGLAVVQSTSPFIARKSFWCINHTLASVGFTVIPYHAYIPSFGEWGYAMVSKGRQLLHAQLPDSLKFIDNSSLSTLMRFPPDMGEIHTDINKLNNQVLVHYFENEWSPYVH
ncbi:MAG TPA: polyamine aminopropyltransferase [Flavipsychrobacter sp.]|nr:polyamine aminopropyltransferase [Flavipsychrobacter sp.]